MLRHRSLIVVLGLGLGWSAFLPASTPPTTGGGERISRLVIQLGSARFKEREEATRALDALGAQALARLREAVRGTDPEVRRRAATLVTQIQRREETAEVLRPRRVRLNYHNTPVSEAVADFARQTGYTIQLTDPAIRMVDPRISLETGEVTFWEAFDRFCKKVGLVEQANLLRNQHAVQQWAGANGMPAQALLAADPSFAPFPPADAPLLLQGGEPPAVPTCYAGAIRIRAVQAEAPSWTKAKDEALFLLEIAPQPKLLWQGVLDVRVDRAVDEQGRELTPAVSNGGDTAPVRNGVWLLDENGNRPSAGGRPLVPVRLRAAETASRRLKEVSGVVAAQVQTPLQPLITISPILGAAGKTAEGPDGETLTVTEAARQDDGTFKLRVRLDETIRATVGLNQRVLRANRVVVRNGVLLRGGMVRDLTGSAAEGLALLDARGNSLPLSGRSGETALNGTRVSQSLTLHYQPAASGEAPAKLVYSGRRTLVVEVPFALHDVPLP
jgi:hypothetical protein